MVFLTYVWQCYYYLAEYFPEKRDPILHGEAEVIAKIVQFMCGHNVVKLLAHGSSGTCKIVMEFSRRDYKQGVWT